MFWGTRACLRKAGFWPYARRRILIVALILGVAFSTVTLRGRQRGPKPAGATGNGSIFVSIGAYRDNECASTLLDLYRQARRPENVFSGVVTYTFDEDGNGTGGVANTNKTGGGVSSSNYTLASERCESAELAPFERNIRRLSFGVSSAKGPSLSRYQAATMYGGEQYLLQVSYRYSWLRIDDPDVRTCYGTCTVVYGLRYAAPIHRSVGGGACMP
ncbi:hypothetical protein Vafri_9656 [Volvox africanus]|uniref:Uncharacterized protein n=1 Tax=Volvox africanus TaxID=51714 RepID=A0A8J4B676_9CHLO|nr:hypothetical protein Vafri_9656 [Volvox africanus]